MKTTPNKRKQTLGRFTDSTALRDEQNEAFRVFASPRGMRLIGEALAFTYDTLEESGRGTEDLDDLGLLGQMFLDGWKQGNSDWSSED